MKKILLLILTLFLFFACFIIYQVTDNNILNYILIGDELVNNPYIIKNEKYKNNFVSNEYRVIDLLRIIKYNEELSINGKEISIHQQLKDADVLIISIGTREIYDNLLGTTKDRYAYINKYINNLKDLLKYINKYDYQKVFFLGYGYLDNSNYEIINYLNTCLKNIMKDSNIIFIDINKKGVLLEKNGIFMLNDDSYRKIYNFIVENLENY